MDSQREVIALHGDLWHDNIRQSARGWLAHDVWGIVGERSYDFACGFRNPGDLPELGLTPERIEALATFLATEAGLDRDRLLGWAAVQCGQAIIWKLRSGEEHQAERLLLPRLLVAAKAG